MKTEQDKWIKVQIISQRLAKIKIKKYKKRRISSEQRDIDKTGLRSSSYADEVTRIYADGASRDETSQEAVKYTSHLERSILRLKKALTQPIKMIGSYLMMNVAPQGKGAARYRTVIIGEPVVIIKIPTSNAY